MAKGISRLTKIEVLVKGELSMQQRIQLESSCQYLTGFGLEFKIIEVS